LLKITGQGGMKMCRLCALRGFAGKTEIMLYLARMQ